VSRITGFPVQYNKAIVGKNAFAHESGIHQDGMLKNSETYEIMKPEDVGVSQATSLVMGKLSGRHAFRDKLESLGYVLEQDALKDAFKRFKALADKQEACLRRRHRRPGRRSAGGRWRARRVQAPCASWPAPKARRRPRSISSWMARTNSPSRGATARSMQSSTRSAL
jgi:hypothetical protein